MTKSTISRVSLDEDKAVMGDLMKGGRKKLFLQKQNRWLKRSEEEPIPVSCPVEIGSECSKMSCNMFESPLILNN